MKIKTGLNYIILALFIVLLSYNVFALTGSIGNARMILYPEVGIFGTTIEKSILVKNVNDIPINITLEVSDELKGIIQLTDKEFILQPGEEKKAQFKIILKKTGDYEGRITVLFKSNNEKEPGVALSSTIIIFADGEGSGDESEEEPEEETTDENEDTSDLNKTITGNIINNIKISPSIIAVSISTLILAVILIFLMIKIKGKSNKSGKNNKTSKLKNFDSAQKSKKISDKINKKRSDRSSWENFY